MTNERFGPSRDHLVLVGGDAPRTAVEPELVGAKAHGLIRIDRIGLPTPPAFVLGTPVCRATLDEPDRLRKTFVPLIRDGLDHLERATGRRLGCARRPLLLSVRSGAVQSMPGMLDTVLNVGANEDAVIGLIRQTGNPRLAWDSYRRLVQGYAEVVHRCSSAPFERIVRRHLEAEDLPSARTLDADGLESIARENLDLYHAIIGQPFPQDPEEQVLSAIAAVFASWESPRAIEYRRLNRLPADGGTAATLQAMVFGNAGGSSGSGVGFSRDPATGARELYMEFLFNAQGEDVVSGRHAVEGTERLRTALPEVHSQVARAASVLEREFQDLQDFEFTIEEGRLYILQARPGKRTPWAALQISLDLVDEGLISPEIALERLREVDLDNLERVRLAPGQSQEPIARATSASIGVAVGAIALDPERARAMAATGTPVILVRDDTTTEDVAGMAASEGIVTVVGGRTSHASVVARQLGKVCLVGCGDLEIDLERRRCRFGGVLLNEGDHLSLDGDSGRIFAGRVDVARERPEAELEQVARWRRGAAIH